MIVKDKLRDILLRIRYRGKWLISVYTYSELCKKTDLLLTSEIKSKRIKYLGYLKKDIEIKFYYNNYDNIFKCVKFLLDNNYTNIILDVEDKEEFNKYILNNNIDDVDSDYVKIKNGINEVSIKDYLRHEKLLFDIAKPAIKLSPL